MNLNDIYLVSQIAAAVLVAPTLIYLAVQVRQNTAQMRANAAHQYLETNKDLNLALIGNKQAAGVYRRGVENFTALDEDEKTQFFFFTGQYYQAFSNMYDLWRDGALPESAWHPIRKHLISMLAMPGTRHVWDSWGREGLPAAFVVYVDRLGSGGEATYSLKDALGGPESQLAPHEETER